MKNLCLLLCLLPLFAIADEDPFESVNRGMQTVNDTADRLLIRPIAVGYDKNMPVPVRRLTSNFFGNLIDVGDGVNNLLQGKPKDAVNDVGRVLVNTTIGIGGLFDPATAMGIADHDEDFAQTLAVWGVPRGAYIVLPFFGPSTIRDLFGRSVDVTYDPLRHYYPVSHRNTLFAYSMINTRAAFLGADSVVFGDRYIFFRDAYLQRREFLEKDGMVEDPFGDDF